MKLNFAGFIEFGQSGNECKKSFFSNGFGFSFRIDKELKLFVFPKKFFFCKNDFHCSFVLMTFRLV